MSNGTKGRPKNIIRDGVLEKGKIKREERKMSREGITAAGGIYIMGAKKEKKKKKKKGGWTLFTFFPSDLTTRCFKAISSFYDPRTCPN